jgi:hypothetical protein
VVGLSIEIPKIDTVVHFTDEIAVAEISTFRDELILVIGEPYTNILTTHHEGQTIITIGKEKP